ncbi:MAG TPA: hypothetical protein VGN39_10740 [Terriglobales bacterium]|jgi:hypothetical protein|nr:hypothetical protein [Terriglobales bacterium]
MFAALPAVAQEGQQSSISTEPVPIAKGQTSGVRNSDSVAPTHHFVDRTNILLFSGIAAVRVLDYTSTRNMLARGREEELIPDDVVYNSAGFAGLEAAGAATSIGISYLLHRTGHHKLERWMSIGHISITAFGAARNYALESKHP